MKSTLYSFGDLELVFVLVDQGGSYIAVNKETPDDMVSRIQSAFDSLVADGVPDKIVEKYLDECKDQK
ncbi:hypothetical protein [Maridesulfovibrio sp.]|uniref:hypothetical protein n=1 Tax=Maridesulfovibrio sp. TaxID=2795000 RepID=UPI002A187ED6|nr:hypothetical protein [Maridesulfovibrio sp.]